MNKNPSIFTSYWASLGLSVLAILMLVNYTHLVIEGRTLLRVFGLIAWILMAIYFIRTFVSRVRDHRQARAG